MLVCRVRARVRRSLSFVPRARATGRFDWYPAGGGHAAEGPGAIDAGGLGFGPTPKKSFEDVSNR